MIGIPRSVAVSAVVAGAALAYYVRQRHLRTGEGYVDIIRLLPSDAQRWAAEGRRRATLALDEGLAAARQREAEITRQLEAARPPAAPGD